MNIRTKLAAVTLAAGTIIGGGAALSMSAAEAAGPVKVDAKSPIGPVDTIGPIKDYCKMFPELCKPTTTSTTTKHETTTTAKHNPTTTVKHDPTTTVKHDPERPYEQPTYDQPQYDAPVKAKPAFTG